MKAIIVGTEKFPDSDAGSIRLTNLAPLLVKLNYSVFFIGYGYSQYKKICSLPYGSYVSLRKKESKNLLASRVISRLGFRKRILRYAKKLVESGDIVIVSSFFSWRECKSLQRYCDSSNAKVIYSVVEYFSKSEFFFNGLLSPTLHRCEKFFSRFTNKDGSVLAISTYIGSIFERRGVNTFVIPFVFSRNSLSCSKRKREDKPILDFIYAGKPGKKDLLGEMIQAFCMLSSTELSRVRLSVYGIDSKWLKKNSYDKKTIDKVLKFCCFFGEKKHKDISIAYDSCDFSILLRNSKERFVCAGFPTKISESLFHGVPPITNFTSDLGQYLVDGENSIEVKGDEDDSFLLGLRKALALTSLQLDEMKKNARFTAETKLCTECYFEGFQAFINRAK